MNNNVKRYTSWLEFTMTSNYRLTPFNNKTFWKIIIPMSMTIFHIVCLKYLAMTANAWFWHRWWFWYKILNISSFECQRQLSISFVLDIWPWQQLMLVVWSWRWWSSMAKLDLMVALVVGMVDGGIVFGDNCSWSQYF